jgi:uncharacterized membrane protein YhhN
MLAFVPYLLVGCAHLIALATGWDDVAAVTKYALMLALLLALLFSLRGKRSRVRFVIGLAIVFSWLGDVLLNQEGDLGFLLGLSAFLCAHVVYLIAFMGPMRTQRPPIGVLAYGVWWIALVVVLAPNLGVLLVPVIVYGFVLGASAAAAFGASRLAGIGALIFVVSDTLLAFKMFAGLTFWQIDAAIMLPYLVGQGLIALAAIRFVRTRQGAQAQ